MRFVLAALAAFVCVVWGGSPLSQTLTAQAEETVRPAPASASELLGSRWNLHIQRTDKETWNSRPYSYDLTVVFLPEGEVIMWGPEINESGRWKVSGKQVTIENDINTKFSFNFADGKTSGKGKDGIFRFNIESMQFLQWEDLEAPVYVMMRQFPTCEFVSRSLQVAATDFFEQAYGGRLRGMNTDRSGEMVRGSLALKGKSDWKTVQAEYERRVADMEGCVVTIDGVSYGLEKNSESYPGQINTGKTLTVYRLKNAPFALQRLNAMVQAEWRGSPWVIVYAGASREEVFVSAVAQLESRDFPWVNVSDAPPAAGEAPTQPDAETLLADADAAEAAGDLFGSIRFANRACQLYHDYAACRRVALAYHNGKGVAKDLVRAREKMIALCHEADYESCFQVGEMLNDAGYENLRIIAAESYLAACNNKHSAACNNLGMFMEREETINMAGEDKAGGTKYAAALRLYVRACDLGNATACRNAGITYNWGEDGVASDHDLAVVYHRKACDLGKTESCGFE